MKIHWNEEKNIWLKRERGIGFEDILQAIEDGGLLKILDHHNAHYQGQKILIVQVKSYTYQVPCILTDNELFMKTIFPSRKYKKFIL